VARAKHSEAKTRRKEQAQKRAELYDRCARTSADAAFNEEIHPALRSYYAGISLWADRRAEQLRNG